MGETPHLNLTYTSLKPHLEKFWGEGLWMKYEVFFFAKNVAYFKKKSYLCGAVLLRALTLMCHNHL